MPANKQIRLSEADLRKLLHVLKQREAEVRELRGALTVCRNNLNMCRTSLTECELRERVVGLGEQPSQGEQLATKPYYVHTFGIFEVMRNPEAGELSRPKAATPGTPTATPATAKPLRLRGKAKEILALLVARRGKELSNFEIYSTLWPQRGCSNSDMVVYFNALRRLKDALARENASELLISTEHGQMANTALFDCDYYALLENRMTPRDQFEGQFLSEYSWGEELLASILYAPN